MSTHVAEPRGWRVPLLVGGGLVALALVAGVLALVTLSRHPDQVAQVTPTPTPTAAFPAATPTPATGAPEGEGGGATPAPGASPTPNPTIPPATAGGNGSATGGHSGSATATPGTGSAGSGTTTPGSTTPGSTTPRTSTGTIAAWPAGKSAWTVILESNKTRAGAEKVAKEQQARGVSVGILHSDDFPSLRKGYYVVFSGQYATRKAAQDALDVLPDKGDAYVRRVSAR